MSYEVKHENKQVIATSEKQTFEENLEIANFIKETGYEFVPFKKKRNCKSKVFYLELLNEEDAAKFKSILSDGDGEAGKRWRDAKKFADSKLAEYEQTETKTEPEE